MGSTLLSSRPPLAIDWVTLYVSVFLLPVLDTDACAVATRMQLAVGSDGVLLAPEHYDLVWWTMTRLLRRVSALVSQDVDTIAG